MKKFLITAFALILSVLVLGAGQRSAHADAMTSAIGFAQRYTLKDPGVIRARGCSYRRRCGHARRYGYGRRYGYFCW